MSCRHCTQTPLSATYSSTVFLGHSHSLDDDVRAVESLGIIPCVTAVCGSCGRLSLIAQDGSVLHSLGLYRSFGKFLMSE